ncbi:MAG: hydrogenase formation protein HypD [Spirochaetes bacterium]|nr:hydrogenase formation protein HypD [Spirochaetota bacterium]
MLKFIDEYRDKRTADLIIKEIKKIKITEKVNIMEVCGGHTLSILKYGIQKLIPQNINLISGPGCPVCVTPNNFIDKAVKLSRIKNTIITTFGDMIKVRGSESSLQKEKENGNIVKICLSTMDAVKIAKENKDKEIIFLGIGFETTAPSVSAAIKHAYDENINNFSTLCGLKTMPNAMLSLITDNKIKINGFICPGHVTVITGSKIYDKIANDYQIPCVTSGFEPVDLIQTIKMILKQLKNNCIKNEIQYKRAANYEGNIKAQKIINEIFEETDSIWRGIGSIKNSGLKIKKEFSEFDAEKRFEIKINDTEENPLCICGDIMRGILKPLDCKLFKKVCTPDNPVGACMVSAEGNCANFFKYSHI